MVDQHAKNGVRMLIVAFILLSAMPLDANQTCSNRYTSNLSRQYLTSVRDFITQML